MDGVCVKWLQGTEKIRLDIFVSSSNYQAATIQAFAKYKFLNKRMLFAIIFDKTRPSLL